MENMERFTPLYEIAYADQYMENLRFDKKDYFHVLVITILQKHSWKLERTRNSVETLALRACVPTAISRYPKLPLVFLTVWKHRKRFLFHNCKYMFDPCFILEVYLNCFFRNSMIKHQIQYLQKCQKLKYLNRQKQSIMLVLMKIHWRCFQRKDNQVCKIIG